MRFINLLFVLFFCLGLSNMSFAGNCSEQFSWIPNTDAVNGYRIYYGLNNLGPYPNVVEIVDIEPINGRIYWTVSGLECGYTYFFVCVAYNEIAESDYSIQVKVVAGKSSFPWELFIPAIISQKGDL